MLAHLILRLTQLPGPVAIVGQQHQAGGIEVQSSGQVQPLTLILR